MKSYKSFFFAYIVISVFYGCVEPFEPTTENFDSILVIEAFITNELKSQEVVLSRTFEFEQDSSQAERSAVVKIIDDTQNEYLFREVSPGRYVSLNPFRALPNSRYQLSVKTSNDRSYTSESVQLNTEIVVDSLYAERITNDDGEDGMAIFLDSFDPTGNSRFYRYEYQETYQIIAPNWGPTDFLIVDKELIPETAVVFVLTEEEGLILAPRMKEERLCYGSDISKNIIITNTNDSDQDNLERFMVRFINSENYILSYRYSILVKQFVLSSEAYTYYKTLRDLSSSESIFSENQPGFFNGNVFSENNRDEKVLGYFDVSSVSERRIFFNYVDFYQGEPLPPYAVPCRPIKPITLMESVRLNLVKYNDPGVSGDGLEFIAINRKCGDCTALGSNVKPNFWTD